MTTVLEMFEKLVVEQKSPLNVVDKSLFAHTKVPGSESTVYR